MTKEERINALIDMMVELGLIVLTDEKDQTSDD